MFMYIQNCAEEKKFSVRMMYAALPISESGFYKWKVNKGKPKAWQKLLAQMHKILEEDEENRNYGIRRMQIVLERRILKRSLSTVRQAMVRGNLLHEDRRSPAIVVQSNRLFTIPVAAIAGMIPCIVVFFVTEMFIHFSIQNALIEPACQLSQKSVFAGQFIFRHSVKVQLIEHQVDYVFFFFCLFAVIFTSPHRVSFFSAIYTILFTGSEN